MNVDYYNNYGDQDIDSYLDDVLLKDEAEKERTELLRSLCPEDTVNALDVGAGHGLLLKELAKNIPCEGIEITEEKVALIQRRFKIKATLGSADNLPFEDNSFDTLYCCEVLEHLPYGVYKKALQELERIARKYIIISVPYCESVIMTRCPYCRAIFNPNYHFRRFERDSFKGLFSTFKLAEYHAFGTLRNYGLIPRIIREYVKPKEFSMTNVCPACGYHREKSTSLTSTEERPKSKIAKLLPKKPRWHIVKFEKSHAER
ncbi:MAG: methyltransferase domain-containing protein [Verrucomicrobiota bacterium]